MHLAVARPKVNGEVVLTAIGEIDHVRRHDRPPIRNEETRSIIQGLGMGDSVKIMDLARRMIELSGLTLKDEQNPDGDIGIEITGLRPGEKLYEQLLIGDNPKPTSHPRIMKANEDFIPWGDLEAKLASLELALTVNDVSLIRAMMQQLVSGYTPSDAIVDWVYMEQEAEARAMGLAG